MKIMIIFLTPIYKSSNSVKILGKEVIFTNRVEVGHREPQDTAASERGMPILQYIKIC